MDKWQKVFSDAYEHRAAIVLNALQGAGLKAVLLNRKDQSYHWGHYEVLVFPEDVMRAIKIIEDDIRFE